MTGGGTLSFLADFVVESIYPDSSFVHIIHFHLHVLSFVATETFIHSVDTFLKISTQGYLNVESSEHTWFLYVLLFHIIL